MTIKITMKIVIALLLFSVYTADKTAKGDPLSVSPPYNPFWVLEDTAFTATCVKEASSPTTLAWNVNGMDAKSMGKWGGYKVHGSVEAVGQGRIRSSSTLTKELTAADQDDFGPASVVCETETKEDEDKEHIFLSVHFFSVFTEHPNITEGDDVGLKCAPGYELAKVTWSRDGHVQDNSSDRRVLEDQNRTLKIRNARPQDAGVYQCTVRIQAGVRTVGDSEEQLEQTFLKEIRVSGKPYLQEETPSQVGSAINDTLTLTCPVAAFPAPDVYWLRGDDSPVETSSRVTYEAHNGVSAATLKISTMTKEDFGVYECVAQNSVGRLVKEFKVAVGGANSSVLAKDLARALLLALCACLLAVCGGI